MLDSYATPRSGIHYFQYAKKESLKSAFRCKVGACLVLGKNIIRGHNKRKTHPLFANPEKHIKTSIHAELDCISKTGEVDGGVLYVYRQTNDGKPAMAKPCEHCMSFLKNSGISSVYYSVGYYPYWEKFTL